MATGSFPLGFTMLAGGVWLIDAAVQNRPPIGTLAAILADPSRYGEILDESEDTGFTGTVTLPEPPGGGDGDDPWDGLNPGAAQRRAVAFARAQLGDPYQWGGTGPNRWDCSGLTQAACRAGGVEIPRTAAMQLTAGRKVDPKPELLQLGDLVFPYTAPTHVAMYSGSGNVIEAPRTGVPVHEVPLYGVKHVRRVFQSYHGKGGTRGR